MAFDPANQPWKACMNGSRKASGGGVLQLPSSLLQPFPSAFRTSDLLLRSRESGLRYAAHNSSMIMSTFHSPLTDPSSWTRVLEVQPGYVSGPVECRMYEIKLSYVAEDPPKYEALSYTWGSPTPRHSITVNEQPFEVGPSLIAALRCLRKEDNPRTLWMDAVCINQQNLGELAAQVDFMRTVYQLAECTLVWLGEEDESAIITMEILTALATPPEEPSSTVFGSRIPRYCAHRRGNNVAHLRTPCLRGSPVSKERARKGI